MWLKHFYQSFTCAKAIHLALFPTLSTFFANLPRFFEPTLFCILLSFCIYSLILSLSTPNFRSAAPIDDVFDENWWHALLLAVKVLDKVYDLIFPFLWEENFACSSWQSTLLWKHTLLFNATLLSFSVRKILLEQICFWTWKWRKMCYFLLFLCVRLVIITYNHVPMQALFLLGNYSLCVKIRINSKTE